MCSSFKGDEGIPGSGYGSALLPYPIPVIGIIFWNVTLVTLSLNKWMGTWTCILMFSQEFQLNVLKQLFWGGVSRTASVTTFVK